MQTFRKRRAGLSATAGLSCSSCDSYATSDIRTNDNDSVAGLMHAFVASRVDYCIGLLAGATKKTTDKLQRVLNAPARVICDVISNGGEYDRGLTQFRRHTLH